MSDMEPPRRTPKLPPLNVGAAAANSADGAPKRKKKKPAPTHELSETDGESSARRVPPRPRSNPRPRADSEQGAHDVTAARDSTRKPRKPKTVNVEATEESGSEAKSPSPKAKKKRTARAGSQEELVRNGPAANSDAASEKPASQQPKKKRKRKPRDQGHDGPMAVGLEADLQEVEEDVMAMEDTESQDDNKWGVPAMRSEPINKLFIEQRGGFKSTNKAKVARKRADQQRRAMETQDVLPTKNTIQFAISSHRVFKTIALFLQGLLGGICLWQIVTVYMLSKQGYDVLLEQYHKVALPVQAMYYFLFAISTVAVFDRNDIARPTRRFVLRSVTLQSGAVACFFYLVGMVFSLAVARTDDKIGLYPTQPELWEDEEARDSELSTWVILNLVRGLLPMLGWFVISLRPGTDRLIQNLEKADENILGEEAGVGQAGEQFAARSGVV